MKNLAKEFFNILDAGSIDARIKLGLSADTDKADKLAESMKRSRDVLAKDVTDLGVVKDTLNEMVRVVESIVQSLAAVLNCQEDELLEVVALVESMKDRQTLIKGWWVFAGDNEELAAILTEMPPDKLKAFLSNIVPDRQALIADLLTNLLEEYAEQNQDSQPSDDSSD